MAIVLEIDNADGRGLVNYARYLAEPERRPAVLRDRMNLPPLLDFALVPADGQFVLPRRSARVRLTGLTDAFPSGGPVPGPLFTGYITSEPQAEFLGTADGHAVHGWSFEATGEEYLLNVQRLPPLPPFLNQTAGAILRFLTGQLQPGRFDTGAVADGALIPVYHAPQDQSWSETARELAERCGFFYRVLDGRVYFQPVTDAAAGLVVDERQKDFRPEALTITPLGNPIQNDVTVGGAIEPQSFVREHFAGDGFTARFPLSAPVFGAESSRLLADDFTGPTLDESKWIETDPGSALSIFEGRLNITGGTGNWNETTLLARQALELGGELEITHGEFEFVGPSTGLLGGLYSAGELTQANCLAGFEASPLGGGTRLRAVVLGAALAPEVVALANHHYILTTRLSADQPFRIEQVFPSQAGAAGGGALPANVRVTLEVRDVDLANPAAPLTTTLYDATLATLPAFAFYAPINSKNLHVVANFLQVFRPIQALLETQRPGEAATRRALGFGIAAHDATITADPHRNQWALEFYEDTIPVRGERMVLSYRAAGRARGRVVDSASMAAESALAGDDGRRAAVVTAARPAPRTSAEAELAALAYLNDHLAPRFEGSYTTWGQFLPGWPRTGGLVGVHCESRYPGFTALVRGVTSELREPRGEHVQHTIEFGQPSRFEDLLRRFAPAEGVAHAEAPAPADPMERAEVGVSFLADAAAFRLDGFNQTQFTVDMGAPPPAGGGYEVRRSDQGWGRSGMAGAAQNLVGNFPTRVFTLPRTAAHHAYSVRPVSSSGQTSRNSCLMAAHYPVIPAVPQALDVRLGVDEQEKPTVAATVEVAPEGLAGVDTVELRTGDNLTLLHRWEFGQLLFEGDAYRGRFTLDNSGALARSVTLAAATVNALGEHFGTRAGAGTQPEPQKPLLGAGNSVGQIIELLLDSIPVSIVETQVQVIGPGGSFSAPAQDALLPGQPRKFNFVATQSGGWEFRARRRDSLGWSPWSNEPQGQIGAQVLVYFVTFFQADELDPSIGAAINGQNLLPNGEFFLGGVSGQEGTHVARHFALVAAAADGSEVDYSASTNEMHWKSGVSFASANPGFGSKLSNLGRLLNPGETVSFSAALRHDGAGGFPNAVRLALRSASTPAYDQSRDIAALTITAGYRWYSAAFALPASQAVPADLAVEVAVVTPAGTSLASSLFCDKVILNRGQRPAAFSLAPWDVVALAWNSGAGAYDLPATVAGGAARSTDPGNAGLLAGTGTEDLDPGFAGRYTRLT